MSASVRGWQDMAASVLDVIDAAISEAEMVLEEGQHPMD